jgi:hypothetical protein
LLLLACRHFFNCNLVAIFFACFVGLLLSACFVGLRTFCLRLRRKLFTPTVFFNCNPVAIFSPVLSALQRLALFGLRTFFFCDIFFSAGKTKRVAAAAITF